MIAMFEYIMRVTQKILHDVRRDTAVTVVMLKFETNTFTDIHFIKVAKLFKSIDIYIIC